MQCLKNYVLMVLNLSVIDEDFIKNDDEKAM